jgi:hypothetical protein
VAGADFLAAFVASCFLGAFPPVDFLAVCFVRAIEMSELAIGILVAACFSRKQGKVRVFDA